MGRKWRCKRTAAGLRSHPLPGTGEYSIKKENFEKQINVLVPQPDPKTTAALFAFGQELGQEGERALLTSLQFTARNFSERTLQGAYEIIRYGSAALPDEMVAAAVYLENGCSPQEAANMADAGQLMCFHQPESAARWLSAL